MLGDCRTVCRDVPLMLFRSMAGPSNHLPAAAHPCAAGAGDNGSQETVLPLDRWASSSPCWLAAVQPEVCIPNTDRSSLHHGLLYGLQTAKVCMCAAVAAATHASEAELAWNTCGTAARGTAARGIFDRHPAVL